MVCSVGVGLSVRDTQLASATSFHRPGTFDYVHQPTSRGEGLSFHGVSIRFRLNFIRFSQVLKLELEKAGTLGYHPVPHTTGLYLLGYPGVYWAILGFIGFYQVLLGYTGFYWVIVDFIGFLPGFTGFYWVLPGFTEFIRFY